MGQEAIVGVMKRGNSKCWYIQFQFDGRTYIKSSRTTDRKLAEVMEADWRKQLMQQQVLGTKDRISLTEAFGMFCDSKHELASHQNLVRYADVFITACPGKRYLDELTSSDMERFRLEWQRKGYSNQTIKHIQGIVRGTLKYANRMGYQVPEVEFPTIKIPKGKLRYLSFDEEKRLLKAIDPRREVKGLSRYGERPEQTQQEMQDLYDFIVILLDTGARHTEMATLVWQRVDVKERTITLWRPKVKNESILYMTDRVYEILTRRIRQRVGEFVFTNRSGEARGYVASTFRRAFGRAGLSDCSVHTLRHTHATRLIQNGLSLYEVKEILGHADIRTTMRYAHIEQRTVSVKAREVINRLNKENNKPSLLVIRG